MPQLVPFYFLNQVTFAFVLLVIIVFVLFKYILPRFVRLFIARIFISKIYLNLFFFEYSFNKGVSSQYFCFLCILYSNRLLRISHLSPFVLMGYAPAKN